MDLLPKVEKDSVELVLTDIPYNNVNRSNNGLRNLDKGKADILTFDLMAFMRELVRVCYGSFYIFCEIGQVGIIRDYFKDQGLSTRLCIWEKNNPSPMNGKHIWLSSLECCIFAKKRNATFTEHCKSAVWKFPVGRNKNHPTEKPLALCRYLIETSSKPNNVVLDPCMGGGSTAVAAKMTGRGYIGMEIEPLFYDIATKRVKNTTF